MADDVIGVAKGEEVTARDAHARIARRGRSATQARVDHADVRSVARPVARRLDAVVARAVVGDDHLGCAGVVLPRHRLQLRLQGAARVETWHDDAHQLGNPGHAGIISVIARYAARR